MYGVEEDRYRPTGFMRNALVAQRVFQDFDDLALTVPLNDEYDWTELLGEQMGIRVEYGGVVHSVLLFMLPEIENELNSWPPPLSQEGWVPLAEAATRGLTPTQLYATLLAGPGRWLRGNLETGTLDTLPGKLRRLLVRYLASDLAAMSMRWVQWNIRDLKKRRDALLLEQRTKEAEAAREAREAEEARVAQMAGTGPVDGSGRRIPPPPQELIDRAAERRRGFYEPPGKT
jgi:hypothetical protein